jgi:hypothetical protein
MGILIPEPHDPVLLPMMVNDWMVGMLMKFVRFHVKQALLKMRKDLPLSQWVAIKFMLLCMDPERFTPVTWQNPIAVC